MPGSTQSTVSQASGESCGHESCNHESCYHASCDHVLCNHESCNSESCMSRQNGQKWPDKDLPMGVAKLKATRMLLQENTLYSTHLPGANTLSSQTPRIHAQRATPSTPPNPLSFTAMPPLSHPGPPQQRQVELARRRPANGGSQAQVHPHASAGK